MFFRIKQSLPFASYFLLRIAKDLWGLSDDFHAHPRKSGKLYIIFSENQAKFNKI